MGAKVIAVGGGSGLGSVNAASSPDATTWSAVDPPHFSNTSGSSWRGIAYSPTLTRFCAVATAQGNNNNGIATSDDEGATWTGRNNGPSSGLRWVVWGRDRFVAVGVNSVMYSTDGISWSTGTSPQNNTWVCVAYSPSLDLFVMISSSGTNQVATSTDGNTWTLRTHAVAGMAAIAWDATSAFFCCTGAAVGHNQTSTDGITWTDRNASASISSFNWAAIASDGSGNWLIAGGNSGEVAIGNGLTTWTRTNSVGGSVFGWAGCCWSRKNGLWVITGNSQIYTSPDGLAWTGQTTPGARTYTSLIEGVPPINYPSAIMLW